MLSRLAELALRHPRRIALAALVLFVVAGVIGGPAAGAFKATNPFADPHSDSARAEQTLKRLTGAEIAPGVLALVSAPPGSPAVSSVVRTIAAGGLSVLGAFAVLRIVNTFLALSVFALNLVIAVGLGLAVDYSLFLVWRFREELGRGAEVPEALSNTLRSTGRTIIFSALTVAAAMASLTVFPQRFLVSMGLGGAIVALVAAASALLMLPALLVLMAPRLRRTAPAPAGTGRWFALAQFVMRRRWIVAIGTAALLLVIASPTPGVHWSGIDATILPTSQSARVVQDRLARDFPGLGGGQVIAVLATAPPSAGAELAGYAQRLRAIPGVGSVAPTRQLGASGLSTSVHLGS